MEYKMISENSKMVFNMEIEYMASDGWEPCGELIVTSVFMARIIYSILMSRETEITGDG